MDLREPVVVPVLPSVDHLPPAAVMSILFAMLGAVPTDLKAAGQPIQMAYNYLTRITDKAVREYNAAQNAVRESEAVVLGDPPIPFEKVASKGHLLRLATDHLETCLDATHRAICAVQLLRSKGIGADITSPDPDVVARLEHIRHAMQHALDRLIGENLRPGRRAFGPKDPYGLSPREHELMIGAEQPLTYVELVGLMEHCYRAAEVIGGRAGSPGGD